MFRDHQLEEARDFCLKRKQKALLVEAVRDMDSEKSESVNLLHASFPY